MPVKRKHSKDKGVKSCIDLIYAGEKRINIVQKLTKIFNVSDRTIDAWIKEAVPMVQERQQADETIRARESERLTIETANKLHITRERVLTEYAKIAFADIKLLYDENGNIKPIHDLDNDSAAAISAIESSEEGTNPGTIKKVKLSDKRAALDSICKVMGYNSADKLEANVVYKRLGAELEKEKYE